MVYTWHSCLPFPFTANKDDPKVAERLLGEGLPASAGAAIGQMEFTVEGAKQCAQRGQKCILVRAQTSADDIEGLKVSLRDRDGCCPLSLTDTLRCTLPLVLIRLQRAC